MLTAFPTSVYLQNLVAHGQYMAHNYDKSVTQFQNLLKIDPYRYESLDLYSNILYIQEKYGELANLAFSLHQNEKYRPETCCIVGNYYALRGDHHKAVIYF